MCSDISEPITDYLIYCEHILYLLDYDTYLLLR